MGLLRSPRVTCGYAAPRRGYSAIAELNVDRSNFKTETLW